jgi:trimethylamine:corrinoid methyltransferase-like protein
MANIQTNDRTFLSAQFRRMSDEQCQKIHWASLEVMERTGVRLYEQEAIELVKKAGAHISDGNRVRFPSGLVEKAFTTVPRRVVLCNRQGKRVMPLEGHRSFFGPGSDCLNIIDHRTGGRRDPVLQDVVEGMIVADALPDSRFRSRWYLSLMNRYTYDHWLGRGATTLEQRAAERVETILAEHRPEPLPKDVSQAVHAIVERAEAEYGDGQAQA